MRILRLVLFLTTAVALSGCEPESKKLEACKNSCGERGMQFFTTQANGNSVCICYTK